MKFIYIDESGTGSEPVAVMVGVIADSYRMRPTKEHWNELLRELSRIIGREIKEIHTSDFYSGNSPWRDLKGLQRSQIISAIFEWLKDRKHSIVYSVVDKKIFEEGIKSEEKYKDICTLWRFLALHLSLSIQKCFQGSAKGKKSRKLNTKNSCVLIFDNEYTEANKFTDILMNAPDWTDSYYDKKSNQEKFNQIIDVPHFVDSKDVGLIQLADFLCFFLRRHIELELDYKKEDYTNEKEKVKNWIKPIFNQSIPKRNIYISRDRCECAELFYKYAPAMIKK